MQKLCLKFNIKYTKCIGWGRKRSGYSAISYAAKSNSSFVLLEDGFISYISRTSYPLSLVRDLRGIYYDALGDSDFFINVVKPLSEIENERSEKLINLYKFTGVSKYNSYREIENLKYDNYILVIDQVKNDLSVKYGLANEISFKKMINSALREHPLRKILLKVHPDVISGKKLGYFNLQKLKSNKRVVIISDKVHSSELIAKAHAIYVVTSQIGFEGLIYGKKVKCFGMPFYAGWGLTDDVLTAPERIKNVTLNQLVHAALVEYPIYRDPETNDATTVEKTIAYIGLQRKMRYRFPEKLYAYGFKLWKKPILKSFTQGSQLIFIKRLEDVPCNATLLIWGSLECPGLSASVKLIRVEDGFLRSVGLGGLLIRPQSWAFDEVGIYYDPSSPSQLENILNNTKFNAEELSRSKRLIEKLVQHRISKYNLGDFEYQFKNNGKKVILVVGQVENDASIRFGTNEVNTNLKLLSAVRKKFPEAYIVYKRHPDVVAGIRKGGSDVSLEERYYDQKVDCGDALTLFDSVDSVHTMTSLVGFEALLRKKKVYTYGLPFYAGWGLTNDLIRIERRKRKLSLEDLVAGCLIRYPTYISNSSMMYTSPERAIDELIELKQKGFQHLPLWRKFLRDIFSFWSFLKG